MKKLSREIIEKAQQGRKTSRNACVPSEKRQKERICNKHGKYNSFEVRFEGRWIKGDCPKCEEEERDRGRELENQKRRFLEMKAVFKAAGMPERFVRKDFSAYAPVNDDAAAAKETCIGYANNFDQLAADGVCLTLCGGHGTGKTHLACSIGNQLILRGKTVLFVDTLEAVQIVRETWRKDSPKTEREVLSDFTAVDLLIMDEVGLQMGSRSEELTVFSIIQGRYKANKPTILISNLQEDELSGPLGKAGADRLKENNGIVLAFDWESYRRTKNASGDTQDALC